MSTVSEFPNLPTRSIVVGAGPGIGLSVARRSHEDGFAVAVVARTRSTVTSLAEALRAMVRPENAVGLTADVTDEQSVFDALDTAMLTTRASFELSTLVICLRRSF